MHVGAFLPFEGRFSSRSRGVNSALQPDKSAINCSDCPKLSGKIQSAPPPSRDAEDSKGSQEHSRCFYSYKVSEGFW